MRQVLQQEKQRANLKASKNSNIFTFEFIDLYRLLVIGDDFYLFTSYESVRFINRELIGFVGHCKEIRVLTIRALAPR